MRLKDKETFLTQKSIDDISFKIFNKNNVLTSENNYEFWRSIIAFAYANQGTQYLSGYSQDKLRKFIINTIGYIPIKKENSIPDNIIVNLAIGKEIYKDISDVPNSFIDDDFIDDSFE